MYFKILSVNFFIFFFFFQRVMERFVVANILVLDKFCVFILNLSKKKKFYLLTMVKLL